MKKSESNEEKEMKRNGKTKPLRNILTKTYVLKNLDFLTKIKIKVRGWVEDYENLKKQLQNWTRVLGYLEDL